MPMPIPTTKLSPRQLNILRELGMVCYDKHPTLLITPGWLGGRDGSHHSHTLAQLCRKGLAHRTKWGTTGACNCRCGSTAQFGHRCKGSFSYDITRDGVMALADDDVFKRFVARRVAKEESNASA